MSSEQSKGRISLADTPALITEQPPRALPGWAALVGSMILVIASTTASPSDFMEPVHPAR
jgi:hypothetical protein